MPPKAKYSRRSQATRKRQTQLIFSQLDGTNSSSPVSKSSGLSPAKVRYEVPGVRRSTRQSALNVVIGDGGAREGVESEGEGEGVGSEEGIVIADSMASEEEQEDELVRGGNGSGDLLNRTPKNVEKEKGQLELGTSERSTRSRSLLQVVLTPGKPVDVTGRKGSGLKSSDLRPKVNTTSSTRRSTRSSNIKDLIMAKHPGSTRKTAKKPSPDSSEGSSPEDEIQTPSKRVTGKGKGKAIQAARKVDDDDASSFRAYTDTNNEDSELELPSRSSRSKSRRPSASKTKVKYAPTKGRREVSPTSSDDDSVEDIPFHSSAVNKVGSQRQWRIKGNKKKAISLEDSDEEQPIVASTQRRTNGSNKKPISLRDTDSDEEQPIVANSQRRLKKLVIDESEDDDLPAQKGTTDSDTIEVDDDSDEVVTTSARRRRGIASSQQTARKKPPLVSPLKRRKEVIDDSGSDIVLSSPFKRRRHQRGQVTDEEGQAETDDGSLQSSRNPARSGTQGGSRSTTGTPARTTRQQIKTWRHRTPKEKQKELLRRRREGEKIEQVTDSETPSEDEEDGMEELKVLEDFPDESDHGDESQDRRGSVERTTAPLTCTDDEEEDFIVQDDDHPLGVEVEQMPLEFTHAANKRVRDHFKDVVEWLVQCKINPSFNRNDPVYRTASLKVDDVSRGYASSQLVSTAWTAEFTRAVYARPYFQATPLGKLERFNERGEVKCDACNHRSHTPTYVIEFWGRAYRKDSLEEIGREEIGREEIGREEIGREEIGREEGDDGEEDDESDDEGDEASVNTQGQELPDHKRKWYTGRNCKSKASLAHALVHWKFRLNSWVIDQLSEDDHLTSAATAKREKMSREERTREVYAIVDCWERDKVVKTWYDDFKRIIDEAKGETERGGRWGSGG